MYYTENDFRLYHSAKGSTWKNHKYISKTGVGESARYKYGSARPEGRSDSETIKKRNAYKNASDQAAQVKGEYRDKEVAAYLLSESEREKVNQMIEQTLSDNPDLTMDQFFKAQEKYSEGYNKALRLMEESGRAKKQATEMEYDYRDSSNAYDRKIADQKLRRTR